MGGELLLCVLSCSCHRHSWNGTDWGLTQHKRTGYAAAKHACDGWLNSLRIEAKVFGIEAVQVRHDIMSVCFFLALIEDRGLERTNSPLEATIQHACISLKNRSLTLEIACR